VDVREPSATALLSTGPEELVEMQFARFGALRLTRTALPWGFLPYDVSQMWAATYTGIASPSSATPSGFLNLVTSCSALILSALFHAESVRGVEALRGFSLPVAATAFTARCPSSSWPARRPGFGASPKANSSTPSSAHSPALGFMHLEGPFTTEQCYPTPLADPLSAFLPVRGNLPLSLGLPHRRPPLMGFSTTLDKSIVVVTLQSFKELKSWSFSFKKRHPPWG